MKSFNLEAAKRGDPLITRGGEVVKFIAYVPEATAGSRLIVLTASKGIRPYYEDGNYYDDTMDNYDLFMAPKKRTVWVNFYGLADNSGYTSNTHISESHADHGAGPHSGRIGGKAYPVEIDD